MSDRIAMKKPKAQVEYRYLRDLVPLEDNPRYIEENDFKRLLKSIKKNLDYFEARPLILSNRTGKLVIIAGNQRYQAAKALDFEAVPTILLEGLTEAREKEIIVRDNVSNGRWDYDALANGSWDTDELISWGVEGIPFPGEKGDEKEEKEKDDVDAINKWVPDCLFPSNNVYDVPTLLLEHMGDMVHQPFKPFGAEKRSGNGVGMYHFYVDDYRFQTIWDKPNQIINSECLAIVEPNLSLFDSMPISYGLHLIYKKRWLARYMQQYGLKVFVDLNVSRKFAEYNQLGVPQGYNAFATRGYADRPFYMEEELAIAKKISGLDNPLMIVYGGGKVAREFTAKHNLIYIEQVSSGK